jgi:formylmethanofuran dehydrogenase subunit E
MARDFEDILAESAVTHGHMCPGQVLGVRMGMLGLALLGYDAPLDNRNIKKVVVVAEIDRCASDALVVATGVRLGRRSLKFYDYGLMAATFVNLPDGRAIRISINDDCKLKVANVVSPLLTDPVQRERSRRTRPCAATDLFLVERVQVDLKPEDLRDTMPARPSARPVGPSSAIAGSDG